MDPYGIDFFVFPLEEGVMNSLDCLIASGFGDHLKTGGVGCGWLFLIDVLVKCLLEGIFFFTMAKISDIDVVDLLEFRIEIVKVLLRLKVGNLVLAFEEFLGRHLRRFYFENKLFKELFFTDGFSALYLLLQRV